MARRIFVSFNFHDRDNAQSVKSFTQRYGGKVDGQFVYVTNDVSAEGSDAIDREIRSVLDGCDAALFIIGDNTHNSPWIEREAELAISKGLHIVLTQQPNTTGACPLALRTRLPVWAKWDFDDIAKQLNKFQTSRPLFNTYGTARD